MRKVSYKISLEIDNDRKIVLIKDNINSIEYDYSNYNEIGEIVQEYINDYCI